MPRCDALVAGAYASAAAALVRASLPPDWPPAALLPSANRIAPQMPQTIGQNEPRQLDLAGFAPLWPHQPLPDSCFLFARKFTPDAESVRHAFFESCSAIGLAARCLAGANVAVAEAGEVNAARVQSRAA